jgi:hypothetical protein
MAWSGLLLMIAPPKIDMHLYEKLILLSMRLRIFSQGNYNDDSPETKIRGKRFRLPDSSGEAGSLGFRRGSRAGSGSDDQAVTGADRDMIKKFVDNRP